MNRLGRLLALAVLAIGGLTPTGCRDSKTEVTRPSAPTGLTATAAAGAVSLTWTASSGATEYSVYRGTATGALATKTVVGTASGALFTDTTVTNDTEYFYQVTASNSAGESAGSNEASATPLATLAPAAPTGVTATPSLATVTLTWDDVPTATSYNIYWSTTAGVTKATGTQIAGATSPYAHLGRINGTTYYYVVTAVNANGESADSLQVSATPTLPPPYISALVIRWSSPIPGVPVVDVEVCTSATCAARVTNATVSVSGASLTYVAARGRYEGSTPPAAGAAVNLSVTVPAGAAVAAGTYTASGTMYTSAPSVTTPTSGAIWSRAMDHTIYWTGGAPTMTSPVSEYVVGIQDSNGAFYPPSMNDGPVEVAMGTTYYTLPGGTLTLTGTHYVWVAIGTDGIVNGSGGIPIASAASGSRLWIGSVGDAVAITAN